MNEAAIRKYLEVIRKAVTLIEQELESNVAPQKQVHSEENKLKAIPVEDEVRAARSEHIKKLLEIDCWPAAVPSHLLREPTVQDQFNRANAVLDMTLTRSLTGLHFLDYGCGDGYITAAATKRGATSATGFDIVSSSTWSTFSGPIFTKEKNSLAKYDVVLLYDVLDHAHDPLDIMDHVRTLLNPGGVVYLRCHPWCSKHASHLFKKGLNKAYIHLFLSWEELSERGYEPIFTRPENDPIRAYRYWFHKFKIKKETFQKSSLSDFFLVPSFKELIWNQQQIAESRQEDFIKDMSIDFVDYELTL